MNRLLLLVAALSLFACPKDSPNSSLGDSDDQKMDSIAAKLEEYHTLNSAECSETCSVKQKVCSLSETACDIAGKAPDRAEYQKRCVAAQEECARFNESCSACKH